MGNHNHASAPVDPQTVEVSKSVWNGFAKATQYSVIGIAGLLLAMALFLLN